uniref:VWFA domain-containing protein n=1 Tax=Chromera velia CCMP2878 TaxID=1169474 RepID=A0A0G4H0Y6_9ALVE|eukprot:Cvel_24207.t1-p1 / transcript=Cvel_24207.t1 / gene=Cvel_24207 / organism=Chromera_velia_CCMP2878 / gene_product=hypothetical protein / transcript_product=hypothetical protein / location=Cvel_scaffold2586:16247-22580(-) / protein_length=531 / sequence_SO=supercontig / SO=protein_coding / is_pseudo=false
MCLVQKLPVCESERRDSRPGIEGTDGELQEEVRKQLARDKLTAEREARDKEEAKSKGNTGEQLRKDKARELGLSPTAYMEGMNKEDDQTHMQNEEAIAMKKQTEQAAEEAKQQKLDARAQELMKLREEEGFEGTDEDLQEEVRKQLTREKLTAEREARDKEEAKSKGDTVEQLQKDKARELGLSPAAHMQRMSEEVDQTEVDPFARMEHLDIPYSMKEDLLACAHTDILVIADDSGSMRQSVSDRATPTLTRWQELQMTLGTLVELLLAVDHLDGFHLKFLNRPEFIPIRTAQDLDDAFAKRGLPGGGTPLANNLQIAFTGSWNPKGPDGEAIVLIATDGEPSDCSFRDMASLLTHRPRHFYCSFLMCTQTRTMWWNSFVCKFPKYDRMDDPAGMSLTHHGGGHRKTSTAQEAMKKERAREPKCTLENFDTLTPSEQKRIICMTALHKNIALPKMDDDYRTVRFSEVDTQRYKRMVLRNLVSAYQIGEEITSSDLQREEKRLKMVQEQQQPKKRLSADSNGPHRGAFSVPV